MKQNTNPAPFATKPPFGRLILYPMNALVNDQLGRLRSLFGDPRIVALFKEWADRPASLCALHEPHALRWHSDAREGFRKN